MSPRVLKRPGTRQILSFFFVFCVTNLYSLLVPIRLFTSDDIYVGLEMFFLLGMILLIITNILARGTTILTEYDIEVFIVFVIIGLSLLATLIMRSGADFRDVARHLRLLYAPLVASLLVLTSGFERTVLFRKRGLLYIPVISLVLSILSSLVQLVWPGSIANLFSSMDISRSTNFVRGSVHNRLIGVFNDPNLFGVFLTLNILFILLHFRELHKLPWGFGISIPLFVMVFFTVSRTALFTLVACLVLYVVSDMNIYGMRISVLVKKCLASLLFVFVTCAIVWFVFSFLGISSKELIRTRFFVGSFEELRTMNNRTVPWRSYIGVFLSSPSNFLLGIDGQRLAHYSNEPIENTFIGVPLKYGILVFLLLCLYMGRLLFAGCFDRTERVVLLAYLFLVSLAVDIDTLQHITVPIFVYLTLGNVARKERRGWRIKMNTNIGSEERRILN